MKNLRPTLFLSVMAIGLLVSCNTGSEDKPQETIQEKKESSSPDSRSKKKKEKPAQGAKGRLAQARKYIERNGFSTDYCFLVDMRIHSGKNRFFVYDLQKNAIAFSGLVAHGSCNTQFLSQARFSNTPDCGCSSLGKYKVGNSYVGEYGKSFRLYGLERSNSNAFKRAVVLHGYDCVPDREIYPMVLCNSLGCPMVSPSFFRKLSRIIERSDKPILLWVYK